MDVVVLRMEKITSYTVVGVLGGDASALIKPVNEQIKDGYQPFGSPFVVTINPSSSSPTTHINQAMVKKTG
jgi:hypothetical protein